MIVADQRIEPLRRLIDMSDHAVHVTVVGQERIDPRGDEEVEVTQRLIDRRRSEDPIDPLNAALALVSTWFAFAESSATGTSLSFLSRLATSVFRFRASVCMSAALRPAMNVCALATISPAALGADGTYVFFGSTRTQAEGTSLDRGNGSRCTTW